MLVVPDTNLCQAMQDDIVMSQKNKKEWYSREKTFSAFMLGSLIDFWQRRQEGELLGVGGVLLRFVRFVRPGTIGSLW
jgi:hypothetical protein